MQFWIIAASFAKEHSFFPAPFCFVVIANSAVLATLAGELVTTMRLLIQRFFTVQTCKWALLLSASPHVAYQLLDQIPMVLQVLLLFLSLPHLLHPQLKRQSLRIHMCRFSS